MTSYRKAAFVLAATDHGSMIVNRLDYGVTDGKPGYGVCFEILEDSSYADNESDVVCTLLKLRQKHHGKGVWAVDCGAHIGAHSIRWAVSMTGWGQLVAIEAQERLFYALCGNIALNNCGNAHAMHAAVSSEPGVLHMPLLDYTVPTSFGSLELRPFTTLEPIGQAVNYQDGLVPVRQLSIDSLRLGRLDFLKLDVEGMEMEALRGSAETIRRFKPVLLVEHIKVVPEVLAEFLDEHGYTERLPLGVNHLCIHPSDPIRGELVVSSTPTAGAAEEGGNFW